MEVAPGLGVSSPRALVGYECLTGMSCTCDIGVLRHEATLDPAGARPIDVGPAFPGPIRWYVVILVGPKQDVLQDRCSSLNFTVGGSF